MQSLELSLLEGEGLHVEFKAKIANLDKEMVAFANTAGGTIFIGVDDEGHIVGTDTGNAFRSQLIAIARNCDPSLTVNIKVHEVEQVIELQIPEGVDKPYKSKDGFFMRVGPTSQKLTRDEIIQLISESNKLRFDETLNNRFDFERDFSEDRLNYFLESGGLKLEASWKDILLSLNVAFESNGVLNMNNTGVLFFSHNPQKFFPESGITIVKYKSYDKFNIDSKKDITGSPIELIKNCLNYLKEWNTTEYEFELSDPDTLGQRKTYHAYPMIALREAIINAITHRDYLYDGSHIYVHCYPDRIEIENPGGLYRGLTLDSLTLRSVRRNRLIADLLHRAKYIERVGSGFTRMKHALEENNNPPYEISVNNFFSIKFLKRLSGACVDNLTSRQISIISLFRQYKKINKKLVAMQLSVSEDTALREINALLKLGMLRKSGASRSTIYMLNNKREEMK